MKSELSTQLCVVHVIFVEHSCKLTESLVKIECLEKHEEFLNEHDVKLLDHDTVISEQLNEENPSSTKDLQELERAANEQETAQLMMMTNNPNLLQLMSSFF